VHVNSALNLSASSTSVLPFAQGITLLCLVVGGSLVAGVIVIFGRGRSKSGNDGQSSSIIRSWISFTLVLALVVFCAGAFLIDDGNLRSTLFGGLIASVGAAVAFYFSSKSADQARADVLHAAVTMSQGSAAPSAFTEFRPPSGEVGKLYTYRFAATGLPAPTYALATGNAPAGLTLESDGTLHGTPESASDGPAFTIAASNALGHLVSQPITVTIVGG